MSTFDTSRKDAPEPTNINAHKAAQTAEPNRAERPQRWIRVVFLDGAEADRVLDLIHTFGTDAVIEHLARYDSSEDTVQDALENGYVYNAPPRGPLDKVATKDAYTLTYSPFLGHVNLLREYDATPDPALLGIDTPQPVAARAEWEPARARRETTDWFTRRPGGPIYSGRGLAL
jgi:hypothetical protein